MPKKTPIQYQVSFFVDADRLASIILNAHSNYWLEEYKTSYSPRHKRLTVKMLPEPVSGFDVVPVNSVVGLNELRDAIGEALQSGFPPHAVCAFLRGEADGPANDVILQLAVFGKHVYG